MRDPIQKNYSGTPEAIHFKMADKKPNYFRTKMIHSHLLKKIYKLNTLNKTLNLIYFSRKLDYINTWFYVVKQFCNIINHTVITEIAVASMNHSLFNRLSSPILTQSLCLSAYITIRHFSKFCRSLCSFFFSSSIFSRFSFHSKCCFCFNCRLFYFIPSKLRLSSVAKIIFFFVQAYSRR